MPFELDSCLDVIDYGTIRENIDSGKFTVIIRKPVGYRRDSRSRKVYPKWQYRLKASENAFFGYIVSRRVFDYAAKQGLTIIDRRYGDW